MTKFVNFDLVIVDKFPRHQLNQQNIIRHHSGYYKCRGDSSAIDHPIFVSSTLHFASTITTQSRWCKIQNRMENSGNADHLVKTKKNWMEKIQEQK